MKLDSLWLNLAKEKFYDGLLTDFLTGTLCMHCLSSSHAVDVVTCG